MKNLTLLLLFFLMMMSWGGMVLLAQLPSSGLYYFKYQALSDAVYRFTEPLYLTAYNPDGYNNQPCFVSKDEVLLTVDFPDSAHQTDIYAMHLDKREMRRLTATVESEYSPRPVPGKAGFSVVRVSTRDTSRQIFWHYPGKGRGDGQSCWDGSARMGYYHWINGTVFVAFLVEVENKLVLVDNKENTSLEIDQNIGRAFATLADGRVAYVKKGGTDWHLYAFDPLATHPVPERLIRTLPEVEDFTCLPTGEVLMGSGARLYRYKPGWDVDWVEIADFSAYGIQRITRLAAGPNGQLILVDQR